MSSKTRLGIIAWLSISMLFSSCSSNTSRERTRSIRYRDIETSLESDSSQLVSGTVGETKRDYVPPFNLKMKEDMLVIDYGQTKVNVYHAQYPLVDESWVDDSWVLPGISDICDWCRGWPIVISESLEGKPNGYAVLSKSQAIENIESVRTVSLAGIDESSVVAGRSRVSLQEEYLCWTYSVGDFPWGIYETDEQFQAPRDLKQIDYIVLHSQFLDGLPIQKSFCGAEGAVYEWEGIIAPSRLVATGRYTFVNPSRTCVFQTEDYSRYSISDTSEKDLAVIAPQACLSEIGKALSYDPQVVFRPSADQSKEDLRTINGTDVEVYCMELSYAVMDSEPFDYENRDKHVLTIVPVWKVYYTVTNSTYANEDIVSYGEVYLNAVTGDSLYSSKYGPFANEKLYPGEDEI